MCNEHKSHVCPSMIRLCNVSNRCMLQLNKIFMKLVAHYWGCEIPLWKSLIVTITFDRISSLQNEIHDYRFPLWESHWNRNGYVWLIMWKKASYLNISCQSCHYMQSMLWLLMLYISKATPFLACALKAKLKFRVLSIWYIDDVSHLVNRFNVIYKISGLITFPVTRIKNAPW